MRPLVVMTLTALLVAACGGDDAGDQTEPTPPEGTPGGVILEISDEGGFVPVEFNLTRVPRFTVFADGTVVMPTGEQFTFPGPAVTRLVQAELEDTTLDDLLTFVDDLGLADVDAIELNNAPNVADASTTVVRYFDGSGEHRISIYALGFDSDGDARSAIVASMVRLLETATADVSTNPYPAERLVVHALGADGLDAEQVRNEGPWPLEITPDQMPTRVAGFPCTTVEGSAADSLAASLAEADGMTTWTHDGTDYRLFARPLLPHQPGC